MRRGLIVGIAVGAAILIAVGVAVWLLVRAPSAEDAARAYLDALAGGDIARVEAMTSQPDEEGRRIVAEAFAGARGYIQDARVEEISGPEAGFTGVRASAELQGERRTLFFAMSEASGRWTVAADYLGAIEVSTDLGGTGLPAGDSVWIGDALAPAGTRIGLLPAEYVVTAAPRGLLTGEAEVAVSNDRPSSVTLDVALSPAAADAAQEQLDAHVQTCTQTADLVPPNCGLRVPWAADLATLTSIAYRVEQRPTVTFGSDGRSFAATGGVVVATATGTTRDGGTGTFTYRADDWALRGTVSFQGDEMLLAVG
jgi:hypothetical protein